MRKKSLRRYGDTQREVLEYVTTHPTETNIEIGRAIGVSRTSVYRALLRMEEKGMLQVTYDGSVRHITVIDDPEREKREQALLSKELARWKQQQMVDLYIAGLDIINNHTTRGVDRVKQIDTNAKLLKAIDSIEAWEYIKSLENTRDV
ncbi:helix-turn-helix domain-containing protein [Aerococcaceae bacterium NML190073]|nr:helix-turn-helix domain-containing protein [Aerococcaceae bacterium NML190073]